MTQRTHTFPHGAIPLVRVVYCPQFEPFQSYLSGPYLKSLLARCGISASCFDANVDFYQWLVSRGNDGRVVSTQSWQDVNYVAESIEAAGRLLRETPNSISEYRWAVNVTGEYLHAISPEGVDVGLTHLRVRNRYSSTDLRIYLEQPDNLFSLYFEHAAEEILGSYDVSTYLLSVIVIDQLPAAIAFAREIKRRRPHTRVIAGGPFVSCAYQQLAEIAWIAQAFDAIVPGEGHRVLPAVLGCGGTYIGHVTPDYSDLDLDRYWSCRRVLPYIVACGCRWGKCAFCSHHLTYEGYRTSRIAEVVRDLESVKHRYSVEYISFSDEYLTPAQLDDLSTAFVSRGLDLKWSTFVRAEGQFCNLEFVSRLYAAGCRMLMFGFESASQRMINAMKKGTRVDCYRGILEACKKANIAVRLDFMIGFPGETEEDAQATYDFIRQNRDVIDTPFSSYAVGVFELRGGIPVLEAAEQFGILKRSPLRGDLDDQYEFESSNGLSKEARLRWREEFIRFSKLELGIEMVTPQNKTHQLILKDLYDQGLLELPLLRISAGCYASTRVELARGVELIERSGAVRVVNHTNGGEFEVSPDLSAVMQRFKAGGTLTDAFRSQTVWDEEKFARFAEFLMRNDYIYACSCPDVVCQMPPKEHEAGNGRVHMGLAPEDLRGYTQRKT